MAYGNANGEKVLLIASYREKYTSDALQEIADILREEKPDKVIISKIIKETSEPTIFKAMVGKKEREDLCRSISKEKKKQADEISSDLVELVRSMNIPSEVHFRKGKEISQEIIDESEKLQVSKVIIHKGKKNGFERLVQGSVAVSVQQKLPTENVITLK